MHIAAAILLFDGRASETTFEMIQAEGTFPRLVELIRDKRDDDNGLHKLALDLLFEMSRMQKLSREDLSMPQPHVIYHQFADKRQWPLTMHLFCIYFS